MFRRRVTRISASRLVFLDEAGANTSMGRTHAWVQRGEELIDPRPMNWGTNLTMIGAIRRRGWVTMGTMFKTANRERFVGWVRRRLVPKLKRGEVVVLDNAQAHHDPRVVPLIEAAHASVLYLPPYSPDFNPIEPAWGLAKKHIRRCAPRTREALRRVAHAARRRVKPRHIASWFEHAGYRKRRSIATR
jgi:transposase